MGLRKNVVLIYDNLIPFVFQLSSFREDPVKTSA